ncbi:hypothetical protein ONZ43_g6623 [Nemania bipapillata]|uniref:Uncharacterized protein n=1 Tax=Nemania bipapillata TaxID=110536 RepID=A0ACC2HYE5_9PEZI|nr:hypothetical protein ONZ43_g6623 [Nemania bipapillata]
MQGVNLRFDFTKAWNPDANHACVAATIRDVTCNGANQRMGLRCLPVLWRAPRDQFGGGFANYMGSVLGE